MSRVFTIFVILALMAVVALVPQMGKEKPGEQGPDLGEGYAYKPDTLRRFRLLLDDPTWTLADPPRNPQWCSDAITANYTTTRQRLPSHLEPSNADKVLRGGSWLSRAWRCQSFARDSNLADHASSQIGFRPAADLPG